MSSRTSVFHIPPNIMLAIFGFLDAKSLCLISRVCRAWYNYANDPSLWKILDLRPYRCKLRHMWKIVNRRISECSRELYINGFISQKEKLDNLSTPLIKEIRKKAPHLLSLTLSYCHLQNVDIGSFPSSIEKLCLDHSLVPLGWFDPIKARNVFPVIVDLNLSFCTRISTKDVTSICHLTTLRTLNLEGCYRITDSDVKEIAMKLNNIVSLDVSDCKKITDVSLHHIGRYLKNLESLFLRNCHLVSLLGLTSLKDGCTCLKFLDLVGYSEETPGEASDIFADCEEMSLRIGNPTTI